MDVLKLNSEYPLVFLWLFDKIERQLSTLRQFSVNSTILNLNLIFNNSRPIWTMFKEV